ncbi:MAG: fimbrillin family protein [Bacteroides sp.]
MKTKLSFSCGLFTIALATIFTTACVNGITEKEETAIPGDIPIRIAAQIGDLRTRITDNKFDAKDVIGLYVLPESKVLTDERYIDNMRFSCKNGKFVPDDEIFYPQTGKCDFISYYPYQANAISKTSSTLPISVKTNQDDPTAYDASNFMTAKSTDLSPSKTAVKLIHEHKLCQVNFTLKSSSDDVSDNIAENITLTINNVCTQATYNFSSGEISSPSHPQDITPNGKWIINGPTNQLSGKKALLIPQEVKECTFTLQIKDKQFTGSFPTNLQLNSGESVNLGLTYKSQTGISEVGFGIGEWQSGNDSETTLEEKKNSEYITLANLDFTKTSVYNIVSADKTVLAEVCQEYLNGDINAQAIVLYPANSKTTGTLLQVMSKSENICGGTITWDAETNSFTQKAGTHAPITRFYVTDEGAFVFEKPATSQLISAKGSTLADTRGNESHRYPIVKIGTQYWMRENLKATTYTDGNELAHFIHEKEVFYPNSVVSSNITAPTGWEIPNETEWKKLINYVNNDASKLKAGTWKTSSDITAASNLSGFDGQPVGVFSVPKGKTESVYGFAQEFAIYCCKKDDSSFPPSVYYLSHTSNKIALERHGNGSEYSIRCIKK